MKSDSEDKFMTYFGYVDRQKQLIRNRHAGEEIILVRGESVIIREGERAFAVPCACAAAPCNAAPRDERQDEGKSVEQLLKELSEMKGLNRIERERFAATAAIL